MSLAQITAENKITKRQHKYLQKQGLKKINRQQISNHLQFGLNINNEETNVISNNKILIIICTGVTKFEYPAIVNTDSKTLQQFGFYDSKGNPVQGVIASFNTQFKS
jgi:hypothetical protein